VVDLGHHHPDRPLALLRFLISRPGNFSCCRKSLNSSSKSLRSRPAAHLVLYGPTLSQPAASRGNQSGSRARQNSSSPCARARQNHLLPDLPTSASNSLSSSFILPPMSARPPQAASWLPATFRAPIERRPRPRQSRK
jgi:hypothetical protein